MRGKISQFNFNSEEDPKLRQKDAEAKGKIKTYADKRANAKTSLIQEGDMVLLRQEKKNKLSTPLRVSLTLCFKRKVAWSHLKESQVEERSPGMLRTSKVSHLQ